MTEPDPVERLACALEAHPDPDTAREAARVLRAQAAALEAVQPIARDFYHTTMDGRSALSRLEAGKV